MIYDALYLVENIAIIVNIEYYEKNGQNIKLNISVRNILVFVYVYP